MNNLNSSNFRVLFAAFIEKKNLTIRQAASVLGCSEATASRLLVGTTLPSDEMLRQVALWIELDDRYLKLSVAEREKLSDAIGTIGGSGVGFAAVTTVVGGMGSVIGLSAAGISSGLAAMGAIVGGGMAVGVAVVAAIPIAFAGLGWGVVQAAKHIANEHQLNAKDFDLKWEQP
jgi:hypothetical protein